MLPLVAIVGRPNVGKSTLFNRLLRRREALVADQPGLTRDRHYGLTEWEGRPFYLVDTGGFEADAKGGIEGLIRLQAEAAIEEADVVVIVGDVRDGVTATDSALVDLLRRTAKPVLCVANKADGPRQEELLADWYALGLGEVFPVSAEHGRGADALIDAILEGLPPAPPVERFSPRGGTERGGFEREGEAIEEREEAEATEIVPVRLALVGRPNAGKSALLNRLVGQPRAIVSEIPGTTRDPVNVELQTPHGPFVVVDTAGIRRKHRSSSFMEQIAVLRALRSLEDADVACLLIDAAGEVGGQDARIARAAADAGRALVLVFSKSDLLLDRKAARRRIAEQVEEHLHFVSYAPQVLLSAQTGAGVYKLLPTVLQAYAQWTRRIPTSALNSVFEQITTSHLPPAHHGRPVRLYYITQAQARPPTFVISVNHPEGLPESYRRYVANRIRQEYGFEGTPLRLFFRPRR